MPSPWLLASCHLLMWVAVPGLVAESSQEPSCCKRLMVDGVIYFFLAKDPAALNAGCRDTCTYSSPERFPDTSFCFKAGALENVCLFTTSTEGEGFYNISSFQSICGLDPILKEKVMKNLEIDLAKFAVYEEAEGKQRYIRPWVQSNRLTDRLGRNSRLLTTVFNSVETSLGPQARAIIKNQSSNEWACKEPQALTSPKAPSGPEAYTGPQASTGPQTSTGPQAPGTLDMVLSGLRSQCVHGEDILSTKGNRAFADLRYGEEDSHLNPATCQPSDQFRRLDGRCNNLANSSWGAAGIAMRRLTPPSYADGVTTPRDSPTLPGPREISNALHSTSGPGPLTTKGFSHMAMQFGQFLDHDITLTPQIELECCNDKFLALDQGQPPALRQCLNIPVTNKNFPGLSCFSFTRSSAICTEDSASPREQLNGITAFVDGSNIYGSDDDTSTKLRELSDGKLKVHSGFSVANLPMRSQCPFPSPPGAPSHLKSGDVRATVQPTLASMHTLFLNEHNRIVTGLKPFFSAFSTSFSSINPAARDDLLFKIARRLVGAELQQIVYREYLPVVLGSAAMGNLTSISTTYRPNSDPSILNEFATVAFRFGHSTVSDIFEGKFDWKLDTHYFENDGGIFVTGDYGKNWRHEMTGAAGQRAPAGDLAVTDALRNRLFSSPDDLVARNLQRGRDHGIPSYSDLRLACGMEPLSRNKPPEINQQRWNNLLDVYKEPSDIDAFTGGLAETAPSDGIVGPLFACIIGRQFERLRDGDRYFYTHQEDAATSARPLKTVAKENILKRSLAAIMCDNIPTLTETQRSVFSLQGQDNPAQPCASFTKLNFEGIAREAMIEVFGDTVDLSTTTTSTTPPSPSSTTPTPRPCHQNATMFSVRRRRMRSPAVCTCKTGFAGDGWCCLLDTDSDGTPNNPGVGECTPDPPVYDNCPDIPNSGQEDADADGVGDACDDDSDNDGSPDNYDNCPTVPNSDQNDSDNDKIGDACDNCPYVQNPNQKDTSGDGVGDACNNDIDNDNVPDTYDNCPLVKNTAQTDSDSDGVGDACDNCKKVANPNQEDKNNNLVGDACDSLNDRDNDGVPDEVDNCPDIPNSDQLDGLPGFSDGVGDACDDDDDNDGIDDETDNCLLVANPNQEDSDGDGQGDACQDDCDQDATQNGEDICPCDQSKSTTDFKGLTTHDVGTSSDFQARPEWEFTDDGAEIHQKLNSRAGLGVGDAVFGDVRYEGTFFVDDHYDDDCVGILFGYQDNKNFYVVTSSKQSSRQGYWALRRIRSTTGHPSIELQRAIFRLGSTNSQSVAGQSTILWQHTSIGWKAKTSYRWVIEHRSDSQNSDILLQISEGTNQLINVQIRDTDGLAGGRLGVYTHSQEDVTWSNMKTSCL